MADGEVVRVVQVAVFGDDTVRIVRLDASMQTTFDELQRLALEEGRLAPPSAGQRGAISGVAEFTAGDVHLAGGVTDVAGELMSLRQAATGAPAAVQVCVDAFSAYCADPSRENLERLREAHEAAPRHLRAYCGDMDDTDIPIRVALYGEKEIENWTAWIASKRDGLPLPTIEVPKPSDQVELL